VTGRQALAAAALIAAAHPAGAQALWQVVPEASRIAFDYRMNGTPAEGRFLDMAGEGAFDPSEPGSTSFVLRIPARGLDLGNPLFSAFAQSAEWFDTANWPEIVYRLVRLEPQDDGLWAALGDITVKGRLVILRTPITLVFDGPEARAHGALVFDPGAVGLGQGPSALFVRLDPEVRVTFDLVARPVPAPTGDTP